MSVSGVVKGRLEAMKQRAMRLTGELIRIKGGCYQMGSPSHEVSRGSNERQHRVCVEDFKMGKYEVTQAQWREVMGSNPSDFSGCSNCPVENVSWNEVQAFLVKLNGQTGGRYRLPTEAEWEYAARAGTRSAFSTGDCISTDQANYDGNYTYANCGSRTKTGVYREKTTPVGSFPANRWGLHDMHGNVWEWTCSAYDADYGGAEKRCLSKNNASNLGLVIRGGSWLYFPRWLRAAKRDRLRPDLRNNNLGFRLAQD
jgi:formylglycine-generating enzyme required for sulfatase activity